MDWWKNGMTDYQYNLYCHEMKTMALNSCYMTMSYPLDLARTLIQMGYEPYPPTERLFFGSPYLALPNTLQYLKYIKSVDGFFGCYRGLGPRLCQSIVSNAIHRRISSRNPFQYDPEDEPRSESRGQNVKMSSVRSGSVIRTSMGSSEFVKMAKHTGWEILSVTVSTIASQPFYVIAVRSIGQFVGRETKYNTVFEAIKTIFQEEGLSGFFSGLVPRIVGDIVYVSLSATLIYLISAYLKSAAGGDRAHGVTMMVSNIVASSFSYQFQVVASTLAVNNAGIAIGNYPFTKTYDDWWGWECWNALGAAKQLKRGSSVIGRYYTGPTVTISGIRRPSGFYFGPVHPAGLGFRESSLLSRYPFLGKASGDKI